MKVDLALLYFHVRWRRRKEGEGEGGSNGWSLMLGDLDHRIESGTRNLRLTAPIPSLPTPRVRAASFVDEYVRPCGRGELQGDRERR